MKEGVTRRSILRQGGVLATIGLLSPLSFGQGTDGDRLLAHKLIALFSDRTSAAELGGRYLEMCNESLDWRIVLKAIVYDHSATSTVSSELSSTQLRNNVSAMVSEDFQQGDTVWLDGWLLARTEARLYALTKLVA